MNTQRDGPASERAPILQAFSGLSARVATLLVARPSLAVRLALAPPSAIHAIGIYLHLAPEAAGNAEEVAARIDLTDARDLLTTALPGCPARLFRALNRAGERVHEASFYRRLLAVIGTPTGEHVFSGSALYEHHIDYYERLREADPLLLAWHDALDFRETRLDAADTLLRYLRAHDVVQPGDLDRPPGGKFPALSVRLQRALDRIVAPDPGFDVPAPWRRIGTVGDLRRHGKLLGNCVGNGGMFNGGRFWFSLANGEQVFFTHDEELLLAVVYREGPALWHVGEVLGKANGSVKVDRKAELRAALRAAGLQVVRCSLEGAAFQITHGGRSGRPEEADGALDALEEVELE